jgi:Domain of unknown function (DUF4252)
MRKLIVLMAMSGVCAWPQSLDLSSLDKLAAKASEVNKVSLDKDQLQMCLRMLPSDDNKKDADPKKLLSGLASIQVRNYEFSEAGEYSDADLDAVRAQMAKMQSCTVIVDSKEKNERSQIFMCSENGKASGVAIIDTEPKEISVVFIRGSLNLSDLGKLNGFMGLPDMPDIPIPNPKPKPKADAK